MRNTPRFPWQFALSLASAALLLIGPAPATAQVAQNHAAMLERVDSLARQEADARLLSGIILVARGDRVISSAPTGSRTGNRSRRTARRLASASARSRRS